MSIDAPLTLPSKLAKKLLFYSVFTPAPRGRDDRGRISNWPNSFQDLYHATFGAVYRCLDNTELNRVSRVAASWSWVPLPNVKCIRDSLNYAVADNPNFKSFVIKFDFSQG